MSLVKCCAVRKFICSSAWFGVRQTACHLWSPSQSHLTGCMCSQQQFRCVKALSTIPRDTGRKIKVDQKDTPGHGESVKQYNKKHQRRNSPSDWAEKRGLTHRPSHSGDDRREREEMHAASSASWGDTFGTLQQDELQERIHESLHTSVGTHNERFSDSEDEEDSAIRLSKTNRRHPPYWYGRKILRLGDRGQVREALKVFEDWMLREDRVMPDAFCFTAIISVLGRAGLTQRAFGLFNKMKKMGIQPVPATYTALFNACSNSPWKADGRARAENLLGLMAERGVTPNLITGKAMVKAFALCGDVRRAFSLVDDLSQTHRLDPETFSFLLMACASDKDAGLRHAIQVWRLMREMRVRPDLPLYNLLLRCVRDCGLGDPATLTAVLMPGAPANTPCSEDSSSAAVKAVASVSNTNQTDASDSIVTLAEISISSQETAAYNSISSRESIVDCLISKRETKADNSVSYQEVIVDNSSPETNVDNSISRREIVLQQPTDLASSIPDVLSPAAPIGWCVSLGDTDFSRREGRLGLLGGPSGVLSRMAADRARPDIVTFTLLLKAAPPTLIDEQDVLAAMATAKVAVDVDLVNALIHKRCMRRDFTAAKAAAELIMEHRLTPNQMTFGVLALTCKTRSAAEQLLADMEEKELAPNAEVMGSLMYAASLNFYLKLWVLRATQRLDVKPNRAFILNVERTVDKARKNVLQAERRGDDGSYFRSQRFQKSFDFFVKNYEAWLKESGVALPKHPWEAFRQRKEDARSSNV